MVSEALKISLFLNSCEIFFSGFVLSSITIPSSGELFLMYINNNHSSSAASSHLTKISPVSNLISIHLKIDICLVTCLLFNWKTKLLALL